MYTVFKSEKDNIIFMGDYPQSKLDELFKSQFGFLCRKHIIINTLGSALKSYYKKVGFNPTSTSSFIQYYFEKNKEQIR